MARPGDTGTLALALLAGCAQVTGEMRGDAAGDGAGAAIDATAPDDGADTSPSDASEDRCGAAIDFARDGEPIAGGHRVLVDMRRGRPISLPGQTSHDTTYIARVLTFTAPEAGLYAVYVMPAGRILRVERCEPLTLAPTPSAGAIGEPLFAGTGRRFRLVRGEALRVAVADETPGLLVAHARRMNDAGRGARCDAVAGCDATSACRANACVEGGAEGAACDEADPPCAAGLRCAAGLTGAARCVAPRSAGEDCSMLSACAEGTSCVSITVGQRCLVDGSLGGRCRDATSPRGACDAGMVCADARCVRSAAPGEACDEPTRCADGASCVRVGDVSRCARDGELGATCRDAEPRCEAGLACNVLWGRCAPPAEIGEGCAVNGATTCIGGHCVVNVCLRTGTAGRECPEDGACDAGLACIGGFCATPLPARSACVANDLARRCLGGRCLDGRCVPLSGRVGEACDARVRCDAGAFCDEAGRCVALGGLSDPCESRGCIAGLTCARGRCLYASAAARACDADGRCPAGRICVERECVAPGVCDRAWLGGRPPPCDVGRFCVGEDPQCVPAGVLGAPCRAGASPCDAGLACNVWGVCARVAAVGESCFGSSECVAGSDCGSAASGSSVCIAVGREGGRCRTPLARADACDEGLVCAVLEGRCRPAAGAGSCSATRRCAEGSSCRREGDPCVRDGVAGGSCRPYAPRCDAGHVCYEDFGVCVELLPMGAACDLAGFRRCADGTRCAIDETGAQRCLPARALGTYCGVPGAYDNGCDEGLACVERRCVVGVLEGGRCDPADPVKRCASGLDCVAAADGARCRLLGTEGTGCPNGFCRNGFACTAAHRCERLALTGEACGAMGPRCANGACVAGRCVFPGSEGGACSGNPAPCEGELVCTGGDGDVTRSTCQRPLPGVRYCLADGRVRCAGSESCVRGVCVADGAEGGLCRVARVPRCDVGLRCDAATTRCVP